MMEPIDARGVSQDAPLGTRQLERCIRHLIYRDLQQAKKGDGPLADAAMLLLPDRGGMAGSSPGAPVSITIGEEGLGLDSLARISAATAVSRFFDLGASGLDDYLLFEETTAGWAALVVRHIEKMGDAAGVVFATSGSTDAPTLVPTPLSVLRAEVEALIGSVLPAGPRRIVALLPPQHIFGFLFTVLLPERLGLPVEDASFRGAGSILGGLTKGDVVVGTPFNWSTLLSAGRGFPPGVSGVTSAGAMPEATWAALDAAGIGLLSEVFGSTETGGLGWRQSHGAPYTLLPHLSRESDVILSRATGAPLPLQDRLDWQDARRFLPAGRRDRAVKIAGVTVSLEKVRATLSASEHVAEAVVRPAGDRLKAFIVPATAGEGPEVLTPALMAHARAHLDPVARPVAYTFGPALPRNEMGKLSDW